jgi:hypothetical protein
VEGSATAPPERKLAPAVAEDVVGALRGHLIFAVLSVIAAAAILHQGRGLTFYYDEWSFVLNRHDGGLDDFIRPHVDHLMLAGVAMFKALYATAGLDHYGAYRVAVLAVHLVCAWLLFAVARRRVGDALALAPASLLLFLGSAWQDFLMPLQVGFLLPVVALLGSQLALERNDRRGDIGVALLLLLGLSGSSLAVPVVLGVGAQALWRSEDRRRRWWVVAVPIAVYAVWWLAKGTSGAKRGNVPDVPHYVADSIASAVGSVTSLGLEWGRPLALLAVIAVVRRLTGEREVGPRLGGAVITGLAYWTLLAVARAELQEPDAVRYRYFGAVVVLLVATELLREIRITPRGLVVGYLLVAAAILGNLDGLRDGAREIHGYTEVVAPELGAVELLGPAANPVDPVHAPDITVGPYLAAVKDIGSSPADSPERIARRSERGRLAADRVLMGASRAVPPVPVPGPIPETCPQRPAGVIELKASPGGVRVGPEGAPVEIRARLFATRQPAQPSAVVATGQAGIALPQIAGRTWMVQATSPKPFRFCPQ